VSLVETLGSSIGVRTAGSPEAALAAEAIADAFRAAGLDPHFQEFPLLGYDAEEPELEIDGERWPAGPCMYAHPTDGVVEGRVRHVGTSKPDGLFPPAHSFAVVDDTGRELAHLEMSPFGGDAIPFLVGPRQIVVGPTAFISGTDANRLLEVEGATARVRVGGRFVPGRTERNVVAVIPGASEETIVVSAHYDSVWRGPGTIDNATGVEGLRRLAERLAAGPRRPRAITFCAFAAEEIGLIGARRFVGGEPARHARAHPRRREPRLHRPRRAARRVRIAGRAARPCAGTRGVARADGALRGGVLDDGPRCGLGAVRR